MFFSDIETERLILKNISTNDREFMFKQFSDPVVSEYLYDAEPCSVIEDADEIIDFYLIPEPRTVHRWILTLKSDGTKIGTCGFHCWDTDKGTVELGYDMQPAYWGQGFMSEAVGAILRFAFNTMLVHRVDAHIYPENIRSSGLVERFGFKPREETIIYTFRGVEYIHNIYSLEYTDNKKPWEPPVHDKKWVHSGLQISGDASEPSEHKRRTRYTGTHPKNYDEKYKELQPEKYRDTIEKVIQKGMTPAGMHIPIMVDEILSVLRIEPGQTGLDATLGYGGHTSKMLEQLQAEGHLYSLDIDPLELEKTTKRLRERGFSEKILTTRQLNFANIDKLTEGRRMFDFVLADLGVSSMQIDNPERGFTFKADGPLDLRLNPEIGISAAQRLKDISREELHGMLLENSDEPYAAEISELIIKRRKKGCPVETTKQLYDIIEEALHFIPEKERKDAVKKSSQRTFQALRIDINNEFEALEMFMDKLPGILKPGGRVAILTFHSGEDRIVKKSFKSYLKSGVYSEISDGVIRPSAEECFKNSRARSTKLRWAETYM